LLRLDHADAASPPQLAARYELPPELISSLLDNLETDGLVEGREHVRLTERGQTAVQTMADARKEALERFLAEWQPEQHAEVRQLLERFARSLRSTPPAGDPVPA
jgi:DNA-binding MarR family transcriptional regulator